MNTKQISNAVLKPIIDHTNANVGSKEILRQRISKAIGKKVHRQTTEGWTNPDKDKRIEPKLGVGLVLLNEGAAMMGLPPVLDLEKTIKSRKKG